MALLPRNLQKMALIVRTDLNMSQGKIAAQCAHAALECYLKASSGFLKGLSARAWRLMGQPKVVLKVKDEKELISLAEAATKAGLVTAIIRDAGRTQLKSGTITVLGIGPGSIEHVNSITGELKLL